MESKIWFQTNNTLEATGRKKLIMLGRKEFYNSGQTGLHWGGRGNGVNLKLLKTDNKPTKSQK